VSKSTTRRLDRDIDALLDDLATNRSPEIKAPSDGARRRQKMVDAGVVHSVLLCACDQASNAHQPRLAVLASAGGLRSWARTAANGILHGVTRALETAIAKLAGLPAEEQDRIARWLLDELEDEDRWTRQFATSQEALSKLAAEARADRAAGRTTELDPDKL
jgi:hypothetical protein